MIDAVGHAGFDQLDRPAVHDLVVVRRNLKTFHQQALDLGALGLDSLKAALARL